MNTNSSIFTSGKAMRENITFGVREIKNNFTLKKSHFLFLLCFEIGIISVYSNVSAFRTETQLFFYAVFDASSVFTGYDIGCTHSLQLKNSLKLLLNKQISRNLLKKECLQELRWPDVTCFHNFKPALLVMSLMSE